MELSKSPERSRELVEDMVLGLRKSRAASTNAELDAMIAARSRPSSFPFVSGDSFRALADLICDETGLYGNLQPGGVAFCATRYTEQLREHIHSQGMEERAASTTMIVHNGDVIPAADEYARLQATFARVMSVNVTPALLAQGVEGLPIGVENLHWQKNGLLEYFDGPAQRALQLPAAERPTQILGCFRAQTNPQEREPLKARTIESGSLWLEPSPDCARYYDRVRTSMFVLSPPGNGPDCHRTWEAIYLGAIPVIKKGTVSAAIADVLPMLQVDDWEELFSLDDRDRVELARSLQKRSAASAYLPYWCRQL